MIPSIKTEFNWNPVEQIYRDSQMANMENQAVYSQLSSPGYSPVSSMESQTPSMQNPFGAGSSQEAVYQPVLPDNRKFPNKGLLFIDFSSEQNYVLAPVPVLGDAPEFNVISRAAASIMQYAKTESLGHVLYLEKNKHTTIEIKSDTIQSGDIISFDFFYENPHNRHSTADDQLKALTLQTRHPDLLTKCSCSESQGFVTITGDHGYQGETYQSCLFFIFLLRIWRKRRKICIERVLGWQYNATENQFQTQHRLLQALYHRPNV